MRLLLRGLRWVSEGEVREGDLRVRGGRIAGAGTGLRPSWGERVVDAQGHLALPGLVNGHDHLELNLFGRLGNPPYGDFYEWGREIYRPERSPLREILRVDLRDRLWWGGYRNLLGGATTVMHHGDRHRRVFGRDFPVRVVERYGWAHSLGHEPDVAGAFARSRGKPFVIHALEGVTPASANELDRLEALGVLASNTVLVHAVALSDDLGGRGEGGGRDRGGRGEGGGRGDRIERVARAGAAIAWCPASNRYLFGRTLAVGEFGGRIRLCLGTDSTLSGSPTFLDELREAAATPNVSPAEVLELATTGGAAVFALTDGRGTLREGGPADLLLIPEGVGAAGRQPTATQPAGTLPAGMLPPETLPAEWLLAARPADLALVLVGGRPRLASPGFARALDLGPANARVEGAVRWVYGPLAALKRRIARAAGEAVLRDGPLWSMLEPLEGGARVDRSSPRSSVDSSPLDAAPEAKEVRAP